MSAIRASEHQRTLRRLNLRHARAIPSDGRRRKRLAIIGAGRATTASSDSSQATDTPPVIQINGDNPAIVQVGATYNDLGATITGPQQDLNLGITTYVNGAEMSPVQIDTSTAATDTIDYVATDQNGLTSTRPEPSSSKPQRTTTKPQAHPPTTTPRRSPLQ